MSTRFEKWFKQQNRSIAELIKVTKELDPQGRGVSRRTFYNVRTKGTCDSRTLLLLIKADDILFDSRCRPLSITDFDYLDLWGEPVIDTASPSTTQVDVPA